MLSVSIEPVSLAEGVPLVVWQASGISQEVRVMIPSAENLLVEPALISTPPREEYAAVPGSLVPSMYFLENPGEGVSMVTFYHRWVG